MTGPRIDPVADYLTAKQQAGGDPVAAYLAERDRVQGKSPRDPQRIHDEYKVGNLARRMQSENAQEAAELEDSGLLNAGARSWMATGANLMRGIKPIAALQNAARSGVRTLASKVIPGVEPESYNEARNAIEGETNRIPGTLRNVERGVGAGLTALALPSSTLPKAIASSAVLGGGNALLNDDPNVGLGERSRNAPKDAAISAALTAGFGALGAGIDKGREVGSLYRQVRKAPTLGQSANAMDESIEAATAKNYAKLDEEAAASATRPTTAAVKDAFEDADVAPFIEKIRASRRFRNADDATVAREADKLMTRQRRAYKKVLDDKRAEGTYDADIDLKYGDLGDAQRVLRRALGETGVETTTIPAPTTAQSPRPTTREALDAFDRSKGVAAGRKEGTVEQQMARTALERHHAENVVSPSLRGAPSETVVESEIPGMMPSHPRAISEKARMEGEREAFNEGSDAAKRMMRGTSLAGKRILKKSPESTIKATGEQTPGQARAAKTGALGRAKEEITLKPQPTLWRSAMELRQPVARLNRLSPFIDALDRAGAGTPRESLDLEEVLKALGLANAPLVSR